MGVRWVGLSIVALIGTGCATSLDLEASPIRALTIARDDGRATVCPGETVTMRVDVEGREGGTRSTASSDATTALMWSAVELDSPSGTLTASQDGAFQADTDVLRAFREGYSVRASLRARPDVTAEKRFDVAYGCLLEQTHTASTLVVTFRYVEARQPRHLLIHLSENPDLTASADVTGRYVVVDTARGDTLRVTLPSDAAVTLVVPREHPEVVDFLALSQSVTPTIERRPQAQLLSEAHAALTQP